MRHRHSTTTGARAAVAGLGLTLLACGTPHVGEHGESLANVAHTSFMHASFSAGPTVFTDDGGHLVEERRYEPYGAPIDAHLHDATGDRTSGPDLVDRDVNPLNRRTDVATGWSDHGARWLEPRSARWLTPDPPVMAPDASFMLAPWALHPYQYVDQNPVAYWDPDGRAPKDEPDELELAEEEIDCMCSRARPERAQAQPFGNPVPNTQWELVWNPYNPYHYGRDEHHADGSGGLSFGVGLRNDSGGSALHVDYGVGRWTDNTGTVTTGVRAQAGVLHPSGNIVGDVNGTGGVAIDTGVLNGDIGVYATSSDFTATSELNLADAAVTVGKDGEQLRGGVSTGLGAAARLHFGQPDAAGNQSVGFGFDLTIGVGVEFDVRTRAPGKAMQWLGQGVMNALGLGGP